VTCDNRCSAFESSHPTSEIDASATTRRNSARSRRFRRHKAIAFAYDDPVTNLAIIYYSTTGHGTTMAKRVAAAAEAAGADVRLRHVAETHDPESFAHNPAWTANYEATKDLPAATGEDIVWADAVIFGTPTRFGSPAAQLRTFIDSLGGLWSQGKLSDKVYAGYTSSNTAHGGQETTLLSLYITLMHWGGIIVPPGYTDPCKFVDGNPYGASLVATHDNIEEIGDATNTALDHLARRVVTFAGRLSSG
jgi:NAD(P)H dehydrogenase (quinone)